MNRPRGISKTTFIFSNVDNPDNEITFHNDNRDLEDIMYRMHYATQHGNIIN